MSRVFDTLDRLEEQSSRERSREVDVPADERMLAITKETGQLLNMLIRLRGAQNMLEIGTSAGYSAIWCAEAIGGRIVTIEQNPKKIRMAERNFEDAGVSDAISIREGQAAEILREMRAGGEYAEFFDIVLIDADKENVIEYFDAVLPMVSVRGVIVTDNMLYPEKYREEMARYAEYIRSTSNVRTVTLPVGNGEEITVKLG